MHVLLLEPDQILRRLYKQALVSSDHTVFVAASAQDAILGADEKLPDAIIVNIAIARHNGIEFLYEFTSYVEWKNVPVIVLAPLLSHQSIRRATAKERLNLVSILAPQYMTLTDLCRVVDGVNLEVA